MLESLSYYYYMLRPSFGDVPPPLDTLWCKLLVGFFLGLCLGSFITMLSYRLPRRLSLLKNESYCPACHHDLGWRDLIPLFSWLLTHGRCRYCGGSIGVRYVAIEVITGVTSALSMAWLGYVTDQLLAQLTITTLVTIAVIALERKSGGIRP